MELSRKAVYPVHKLDVVSEDRVAHEIYNDDDCLMEVGNCLKLVAMMKLKN